MSAITNVSRREFLGGVFSTGAFVLAAQVIPRSAWAQAAPFRTQAESAPLNPSVYLGIRPDGTVFIVTHRSEMGTGIRTTLAAGGGRRARGGLEPGDHRAGNRRSALRRPEHRRLAIDPRLLRSVPPRRRHGAVDAGERGGGAVERARVRVHGPEPRSGAHAERPQARLRRAGAGGGQAGRAEGRGAEVQAERPRGASSARTPSTYDQQDIVTGKAQFGLDVFREGMVHASIEHPPVLGGTIRSVDDSATKGVKGVQQTVRLDTFKPPHLFQPLGGVAVIADSTWAALKGRRQLKVEWNDGAHGVFESEAFKKELLSTVQKPGKVLPQPRQRRGGVRQRRQDPRSHLLHAARGARVDGTAGGGGRIPGRQGHGLGADAESAGGAGHGGRSGRHRQEGRHLSRDAARRRLRQEVEAGLLRGSGGAVEAARQAGQGDLDARGRHSPRLLPHDGGGLSQGVGRRPRQADGVAAPIGLPADRLDVRRRGARAAELRARPRARRPAVRRGEHPRRERSGRRARAHRLVPRGLQQLPRVRGAQLRRRDGAGGGARLARVPARHARTGEGDRSQGAGRRLLELRRADREVPARHAAAAPRAGDRGREIGVGQEKAGRRLGPRHRRARAASTATSPRWSRSRSTRAAPSRSRGSSRWSTPA